MTSRLRPARRLGLVGDRCRFTEFYRTQASALSKVLDFMGSG